MQKLKNKIIFNDHLSKGDNSFMRRWAFVMGIMALIFVLAGCQQQYEMSILDAAGTTAEIQERLIWLAIYIMSLVVTVVTLILIYVLIRYRRKRGDDTPPKQVEGNNLLEAIWVIVPIILIAILAVPTVTTTFSLDQVQADENAITVKVVGAQFWWQFEYPDYGIVTAQELHIPVGTKVNLELETRDTLHSFWVPRLSGKTDLISGRTNFMWMEAQKPGTYIGKCAELCGDSHALMDFLVVAESREDFDRWVESMKNPQTEPTNALSEQGQQIFAQSCAGCHAVAGTEFAGTSGPDLTGFGNRQKVAGIKDNTDENVAQWIKDPASMKPGSLMPAMPLSDEDVEALVAYLKDLK